MHIKPIHSKKAYILNVVALRKYNKSMHIKPIHSKKAYIFEWVGSV